MDDNKKDQDVELNENQTEEITGGVISGGNGPLTDAFSGNGTNPGEVPPPVPPQDPNYKKGI